MPTSIGVRELKNRASQVIRTVREELSEYVITVHGEPVAILRPLDKTERQRLRQADIDRSLLAIKATARRVAAGWQADEGAVELIVEQRR